MRQQPSASPRRMIVGISGATGVVYGLRLLAALRRLGIESHLVMTKAGERTLAHETDRTVREVRAAADRWYPDADIGAAIASGSFRTMGMVVAPCSVRSLSAIATGDTGGLLTRAADVCLKERRRLVLLARETPLHLGHLRLMEQVTAAGAVVLPPVPGFYHRPQTILELVDHLVFRILDQFGIPHPTGTRWKGEEVTSDE